MKVNSTAQKPKSGAKAAQKRALAPRAFFVLPRDPIPPTMSSSASVPTGPPRKRRRDANTPPMGAPNAQRRRGGPHAPMPPLGARAKEAIRAWADGFHHENGG